MKKIISVVGARPNFMKVAPIIRASAGRNFKHMICHTGQHYDYNLSDAFFRDLELPQPDYFLGVGSGTHAEQTAKIMVEFEKVIEKEQPDLVIVVGDVNSTIACGLTSVKLGIKLAHIEAGLRSFDREMPEEINRIATDSISDYFFVTEESAITNLKKAGINHEQIFFVGNTMIDSLVYALKKCESSDILTRLNLNPGEYVLATLHRPSNVDNFDNLNKFLKVFEYLSKFKKIVFPIHPRTTKMLFESGLLEKFKSIPGINLIEPAPYLEFLNLMKNSAFVMTDSGGIQEETTFLDIPCLTLRTTTERPITIELGTNFLCPPNFEIIINTIDTFLINPPRRIGIPPLWDGNASERIVTVIEDKIFQI
jgi:UDP-N-acetylglucosamine 2-epimerase (non-hydrolysing)